MLEGGCPDGWLSFLYFLKNIQIERFFFEIITLPLQPKIEIQPNLSILFQYYMFKSFKGFHLVETYQELKKAKRLDKSNDFSRVLKVVIAVAVSLALWFMPATAFGIPNLTVVEHRLIAIFTFATLMWLFEAIPAWTTSVLVVVILLFTVSNSSFVLFTHGISPEEMGTQVKYTSLLHCFADPIIMLFIGGFVLAIAATRFILLPLFVFIRFK